MTTTSRPPPPTTGTADGPDGREEVLRGGERVRLRAVRPADAGLLARGFDRLGAESRFRRFFTPLRSLSPSQLDLLSRVDHHDHEAIVAVIADRGVVDGVGVARFVRSRRRPGEAEVAVTVVDEWQRRGVGGLLLRALAERAVAEGVHRFTADALAVNTAVPRLFRALGPTATERAGSQVAVTVELSADVTACP
jgi:RimJ/RimL family protein N-acetyltransferase